MKERNRERKTERKRKKEKEQKKDRKKERVKLMLLSKAEESSCCFCCSRQL
jgi:hypothetical protein